MNELSIVDTKDKTVEEDEGLKILKENEIKIMINMNSHKNNGVKAVSWGCDLTYDYVKINSAYRS